VLRGGAWAASPGNANLPIGALAQVLGSMRTVLFLLSIVFMLSSGLIGCASPGEPIERKPPVPQAVTDLAATQAGNGVLLTFALPTETTDRRPLGQPLSIEVYRSLSAAGAAAPAQLALVATIPSANLDQSASQGRVRYVDSLRAEDFGQNASLDFSYSVRTRASEKKVSEPSNIARLVVRPAADPIEDLKIQVTQAAVLLSWTAPQKTLVGPAAHISGYRIYRAEAESAAPGAESGIPALKSALAKNGESESNTFEDAQFEFGKSYVYSVRSVLGSGVETVESADSNLAEVTPRDTFPPASPQGLVIAAVPQRAEIVAHLELSWAVSPETDVAGYNVYRSEEAGAAGARLNTDLLPTPAFRDMNVEPGHRYFYSVTAIDRSGNESLPSEVVSGGVPAASQPTP
jgi:hypothetical protein